MPNIMDYSINQNPQNVQPQQPEPKKHIPTWLGLAIIIAVVLLLFAGYLPINTSLSRTPHSPKKLFKMTKIKLPAGKPTKTINTALK